MKAIRLRTEYLENPLGLGTRTPRLFWNCEGGEKQSAYEVSAEIDGCSWSSGRMDGGSMHFDFGSGIPGANLDSRSRVVWKVRLWDEAGEAGEWSDEAFFELGLLNEKDWKTGWMSGNYRASRKKDYPVDCFRKKFFVKGVKKARLYASACGIYEAHINGSRVGHAVLTPGATDHRKRVQVQAYDVTGLLRKGENELRVELAGGWFKSYLLSAKASARYGCTPKVLIQLEITDEAGNVTVVGSDETWDWSNDGPVRYAENKGGEVVDARMEPGYGGKARRAAHPVPRVASDNVAMQECERLRPTLVRTPSGKTVLDFGQNIAGFLGFDLEAKSGDGLTLYMGEWLERGEFTQRNIDPNKKGRPFQKIEYICKEGRNRYKTRFAIFGFQYVLVETDLAVRPEEFEAIVVWSKMEDALEFHSDHALLNQLVECTRWSARNNSADVPTDCPTRERVGWSGDAQIFYNTAAYLFDYAAFGRKYVRDLRDAQHGNGSYTQAAPRCAMAGFMNILDSSAGWADAGVLIPYRMWKRYGDERILREHYESMKRYGNFLIGKCDKKRWLDKKINVSAKAAKYLVATGLSYGEWLEPKEAVEFSVNDIAKPHVEENTAYTAYVLRHLAEIARYLGHEEDAKRFRKYEKGCTLAYRELVALPEFSLDTDRQAKLVRPLYMNLLDEETREWAKERLVAALDAFGWRVGTGFLSTPFLLFVLQEIDAEKAYRLLENERLPGWLAMPKNGATTIWENWEGTCEENPVSLDHYSKGAVCEWIFSELCGVHVAGENRFLIKPCVGGSLGFAALRYQSVYGEVHSEWRRENGTCTYTVKVPANTTAKLVLPDGERELRAGEHVFVVSE